MFFLFGTDWPELVVWLLLVHKELIATSIFLLTGIQNIWQTALMAPTSIEWALLMAYVYSAFQSATFQPLPCHCDI